MNEIERVRDLVKSSPFTYDEIADGAPVGRSWLDKFMQGKIADPGISKIERLRSFIAQRCSQPSETGAA